ncbi:MAG: S-layer homology domain-containing protein [Clostridia bacterium]|nr:S-layer homology domain-containing protein [Clostridia bacterium]
MKLSRRILSAFLAILMVCSVITVVSAANVTFTDVSGHWAWTGGQIQYLVDKGVLNGYKQSNGTYKFVPDGQVTRAEFIKMLDETFGLTTTASISYSDVKTTDWFHPYFAKAAAQGYLLNYGTSVNPNGQITREEAISLLVRYLDLPANEKAATTYFSDYYSISENYRDYVLCGIYAGLTDGYNEGGGKVFKPKNTLTRAEALTILYRAAGCIFNLNAYSRDSGAAATNNVITRGGVILNGINLQGRVIISEGATAGTVSLSGCSVADTLEVRGTADVTLDDCKIKNIVITNGCKLSLLNGTEVENITVYGKSTIGVYSGITLGVLDIGYGADKTSVTGDGAIKMAYINASGFTSSMVPSEFQIGNNLTATFAGSQYQGSSDAQESFTMTPFITSDSSNYYLNLFPAVDGKVYYYFTNGANAPTTAKYDSYYDQSSFTGMITVKAGEIKTEKTYSANSVKNFEYVVLQLQADGRKYAPVLIPNTNTDGTGFTTVPYLADETTVKFVASEGGTLYWYYSKSGEKMTQAEFLKNYSNTDNALRNSSTGIVSGRTQSIRLESKYLKNYDYVVLMFKNTAGSYYTPVVVSAGDNGFAEGPALKSVGTVAFKTTVSGELYYYYAEEADLPAPEDYKAEYNRADEAKRMDVKKNSADTFTYDPDESEDYPYLIIAIKNSDGEWMQPVALNIDFRTGFKEEPYVYDETTIKFETEDDGEVRYYYTKSETVPSAEGFKSAYSDAANKYKDEVNVDGDYTEKIEYSQTYAQNYPYMVFMFIDDQENEYTPVIVELDTTANTGFKNLPYIQKDKVYFMTEEDGEVWYYFSRDGSAVASSEFEEYYDEVSKGYLYGQEDAVGGKLNYFEIDEDVDFEKYPYLVIAFLSEDNDDDDDRKFNYPVILDVEDADISGTGLSVDGVDESEVCFTTLMEGRVYYYFTDEKPSVSNSNFERRYDDASSSDKDDYSCDEDEEFEVDYDEDDDYRYLVICVEVEDSDGDEHFLNPVVVNLSDFTSTEDDDDDDATTSKTGLSLKDVDIRDHVITLDAEYSGEVTVFLYVDGKSSSTIGSFDVSKNDTVEFDYSKQSAGIKLLVGMGSDVEIVFQLVNGDETYKKEKVQVFE